jgi:hypothetical protein
VSGLPLAFEVAAVIPVHPGAAAFVDLVVGVALGGVHDISPLTAPSRFCPHSNGPHCRCHLPRGHLEWPINHWCPCLPDPGEQWWP